MKISTTPNKLPDCVHTDPNVRWIMRQQSVHHMGDDVSETVMVLQQLLQDGWGNDFWADVQIKQRNKPMTKLEELKAASDAAYHACNAACATYAIACKAAWAPVRVADANYAAAYHAWIQAELNKTKETQ